MKRNGSSRIVCMLLALILALGAMASSVSAASKDIEIEVKEIISVGDEKMIYLEVENNMDTTASFGWVNSCQFVVTTTEGTYSRNYNGGRIFQGSNEFVVTIECPGKVKTIMITDLRQLDSDGLPNRRLENITIYDKAEGIDSYSGNFPKTILETVTTILLIAIPIVFVLLVILTVIVLIRHKKKQQNRPPFVPYGGPVNMYDQSYQMHQQATQMHQQATQMHWQAHQQAVHIHDQIHQQQTEQFQHQAANFTDMGGFNPPPPPPPPGF